MAAIQVPSLVIIPNARNHCELEYVADQEGLHGLACISSIASGVYVVAGSRSQIKTSRTRKNLHIEIHMLTESFSSYTPTSHLHNLPSLRIMWFSRVEGRRSSTDSPCLLLSEFVLGFE